MLLMFRIAVSVIILSANALACSFVPPVHKVAGSFSVHVKNDVGSVAGLKLKVSRFKMNEFEKLTDEQQRSADPNNFEEVLAESITDATGTARFNLDRTGVFTLSPESPASQLDWVELDVSDQPSSPVLELQWPSVAILRTAYLRGKLAKGLFSSRSAPLKENALRLHTLVEYREVAATTTGDDGAFDFRGVAPGLYFLQILATPEKTDDFYKPEGNIAIYVAPDNSRDSLMISTANTSCGLSYDLDENKARYKPKACFKGGKPVECDY
jgi:hypothetical protein